jgi:hypothetical protein
MFQSLNPQIVRSTHECHARTSRYLDRTLEQLRAKFLEPRDIDSDVLAVEAEVLEAEMNGRSARARRLTSSRPGNVDPAALFAQAPNDKDCERQITASMCAPTSHRCHSAIDEQ